MKALNTVKSDCEHISIVYGMDNCMNVVRHAEKTALLARALPVYAYDAIRNEKYYLSFVDSNILRLFRFHKAALEREGTFVVACHQEQLPFLQTYFGDSAKFAVVNTEKLESILNIEKRDLILEG